MSEMRDNIRVQGRIMPLIVRGRTLLAIDPTRHNDAEKRPALVVAMRNALWRYENGRRQV